MRLLVASGVLLSVFLVACGGGGQAPVAASAAPERVGGAGVTIALPPGWHAGTPDDGNIVDPVTRFVVASSPIQPNGSPCQIAHYSFAEEAVALVLVEWNSPQPSPPTRPGRFTSSNLPVQPKSIECFDGPGGSVHFTEGGRVFAAYLLVGERAPSRLVDEARELLDSLRVEPGPRTLVRNGVSITAPPGWHGRMLFTDAVGSSGVLFQVANFELPPNEGFEPPRELPPGEEDPIKAMSGDDVLVMVAADQTGGRPARLPLHLDDLRFLADGDPLVPRGHALASGSFCFGRRCLRVEVDFGGGRPGAALAQQVDAVLASLTVPEVASADVSVSRPLPRGWHVVDQELTAVVYPRQVGAFASFPLRQTQPDRDCIPKTALEQMPAGGAMILLLEYTGAPEPLAADFPPRPVRFRLTDETFGIYGCYGRGHALRFRDQGRQLQFQVMLGDWAGAARRTEVLEILNGLRVAASR